MGDVGDAYRDYRAAMREKKEARRLRNETLLRAHGLAWRMANAGVCWTLRDPRYPRVDFYPGTNRWRDVDAERTHKGDATKLIDWLEGRRVQP